MDNTFAKELKKDCTKDASAFTWLRGCYVDSSKNMVATFSKKIYELAPEDCEKYMDLLKTCLTGKVGKNLMNMVASEKGTEMDALESIREEGLDSKRFEDIYDSIIRFYPAEDNYLILAAGALHDIEQKDGSHMHMDSEESYSYIVVCICPVKENKPLLIYTKEKKDFLSGKALRCIGKPKVSFVYPNYDSDGYMTDSLFVRAGSGADFTEEFMSDAFGCGITNAAQKSDDLFKKVISAAITDNDKTEYIKKVEESIDSLKDEVKRGESTDELRRDLLLDIVKKAGADDKGLKRFEEAYEEEIGEQNLSVTAIEPAKNISIRSENVSISIKADYKEQLTIANDEAGNECIMIRIEPGTIFNGYEI